MIKSMTAYGRGEVETPSQKWVVELRSLNHRFLELSLNLPKRLWALEDQVRKLIKSRITRGRVEMQLTWENLGDKALTLRLDQVLVREVRAVLRTSRLPGRSQSPCGWTISCVSPTSWLPKSGESGPELEETWELVSQAITQALDILEEMRLTEGAALAADLAGHLEVMRREFGRIADQAALLPELWREKVSRRLAELFPEGSPVDETPPGPGSGPHGRTPGRGRRIGPPGEPL